MSIPHVVNCSVPQGSILGPVEFPAYTEHLDDVIHSIRSTVTCMLMSDDTHTADSTNTHQWNTV